LQRPWTNSGKDLFVTSVESTSTKATVAFLSASASAWMDGSIAPGPRPLSLATDRSVSSLRGLSAVLIWVISRSERKFVKKPIYCICAKALGDWGLCHTAPLWQLRRGAHC
jgi:hypothetical protein